MTNLKSKMSEIRISSWDQLLAELHHDAWKPQLGRFRSTFAFRGMEDATDDLTTTLYRLRGPFLNQEGHLLRNFRKYAHRDAVPGDSLWNWLSLAQHHGLPTRLLDWTFSPLVAMHFVTQDLEHFTIDGVIWAVDYVKTHALLPRQLRLILKEEQADVFTTEMLGRAADQLSKFDELSEGQPFAVFLEPPSLDDRIVNQFALLSLMSDGETALDKWLEERPELYRRIVIPAELKWEIRDKLDQANVTERVLFPGLDGLSRWLKRYYSPRTERKPMTGPEARDGDEAKRPE